MTARAFGPRTEEPRPGLASSPVSVSSLASASALESPPAWDLAQAPDKTRYRDAMSRLGAAVHVVTTDGPGGRAGFTASAVCSVTDEPPTLLVCLNRSASAHAAFARNQVLCVNTLVPGQEDLSNAFGGKTPMDERFAAASWRCLATGAPVLAGAAVSFDCRVVRTVGIGTHDVLFCEVQAIAQPTRQTGGLIYLGRRYHGVGAGGAAC